MPATHPIKPPHASPPPTGACLLPPAQTSRLCLLLLALLFLTARPSPAWIDNRPGVFERTFGEVVLSSNTGGNLESRLTRWRDLTVEILLENHTPRHATYHMDRIDYTTVNQLLALHGRDLNWDIPDDPAWNTPDAPPRRWIRSDGAVEMQLGETQLTLLDPSWTPPDTADMPDIQDKAIAAEIDMIGNWQLPHTDHLTGIFMVIRSNGDIQWIEQSEAGQRVVRGRWEPTGQPLAWRLHAAAAEDQQGDWEGRATLLPNGNLRLHPSDANQQVLTFHPVERIPRWRPPPPDNLPKRGMTREMLQAQFGSPTGRMAAGKQEVLLYPWGRVWMANGQVVAVE